MTNEQHTALRTTATHVMMLERMSISLGNMVDAFGRDGWPEEAFAVAIPNGPELLPGDYTRLLDLAKAKQYRTLSRIAKGSPLSDFVEGTRGLGPACYLFAGQVHKLSDFAKPSGLWKYCGLHTVRVLNEAGETIGHIAPKRKKGERAGFSMRLRAIAIARIAGTVVKVGGPYREMYDRRKEHTATNTHPPMFTEDKALVHPDCEHCQKAVAASKAKRAEKNQTRERKTVGQDCANTGGVHWTDGHRHADALRYIAKAILLDLWLVSNELEPHVGGGQGTTEAHDGVVPAGVSE